MPKVPSRAILPYGDDTRTQGPSPSIMRDAALRCSFLDPSSLSSLQPLNIPPDLHRLLRASCCHCLLENRCWLYHCHRRNSPLPPTPNSPCSLVSPSLLSDVLRRNDATPEKKNNNKGTTTTNRSPLPSSPRIFIPSPLYNTLKPIG